MMNALAGGEFSEQKLIKEGLSLIKAFPDVKDTALWAADLLFSFVVPSSDPNAKLLDKLAEMMQKQTEMEQKLDDLNKTLVKSVTAQQINNYLMTDTRGLVKTYYGALRNIDDQLNQGAISSDEASEHRLNVLTRALPKTTGATSFPCEFDEFTYSLGSLLTMDYLTSGLPMSKAKLVTLYDEWMRLNVKWEHQGYEDRALFRNYVLSQYLTAASIDKLSLIARIQELPESQRDTLNERLLLLNEQIEDVSNLFTALEIVKRDDSERYYQVPGHEMLFFSQAYQPVIPSEDPRACLTPSALRGTGSDLSTHISGITGGRANTSVIYSFWYPLIRYNGHSDEKLTSYNTLHTLLSDYQGQKDLFQIFFDDSEGAFTKPAGASDTWAFVIDPDNSHLFHYEMNWTIADKLYAWIVNKNGAASRTLVMNYHNDHVEKNGTRTDFIGIGMKPIAVDNAPSANTRSSTNPIASYGISFAATNSIYAQNGSHFFVANCDIENFTGAKINDDLIIKGTDYFVEAHPDGGITLRLSNDLLDALPDGQHSLHLYFTDGHGEILFDADSLSSDSSAAVSSVPDVPATGDAPRALILLPVMALLLTALLPLKKKAYSISK